MRRIEINYRDNERQKRLRLFQSPVFFKARTVKHQYSVSIKTLRVQ